MGNDSSTHAQHQDREAPVACNAATDKYARENFMDFYSSRTRSRLHTYLQQPDDKATRGVVIMLHGLSQHVGNSVHIARRLAHDGYVVCGYDHEGFGQSEGVRGYIHDVHSLVEDATQFAQRVRSQYPGVKVFMCGESLGGLVTYRVALLNDKLLDGVILMNAALGPTPASARFGFLAKWFGAVAPTAQLLPRVWGRNSKNPAVERYLRYEDPYYYRERVRPGTLRSITLALEENVRTFDRFACPALVIQGLRDKVVDARHAQRLSETAANSAAAVTLALYENMWHCSWLEEEIHDIVPRMIRWLDERVQK